MSRLRLVSFVSGLYDVALGVAFLAAAPLLAQAFGIQPPQPPVLADTNGLFLLAVGIGYWFPWRDPVRWRGYLWVMGPLLKGGGAIVFLRDYLLRDSPTAFVLFALSDGSLALWTWLELWRTRGEAGR